MTFQTSEETPMSQSQVNALCADLLPRVVVDDARLLNAIRANLRMMTGSLGGSIDAAVSMPGMQVSGGDRARLDLVRLLDDISGHSVDLIMFCFSGETSVFGSLRQLAAHVFTLPAVSPDVPAGTEASWARLRARLFGLEPTAVMLGLARSGSLPLPDDPDESSVVLSVLEAAAGPLGFDIARESMRRFLDGDAVKAEVPSVGDGQRQASRDFLFRLQRLQALVNEPEDIGALMRSGFRSADDISKAGDAAVQSLLGQGIPQERAAKIRNHAVVVAIRSEGLFTAALRARGSGDGGKSDALAAISAVNGPVSLAAVSQDDEEPPLAPEINLSAMFKLENMGCADCASITGPAAYYVDLLQTVAGIKLPDQTSLLKKLFERRPDLGDLELSCANTQILIPYIDLVNEVLESVLWYLKRGGDQMIPPFDMDDSDTCDSAITQPRHVNYTVYSDIVQKMVYPMTTSPYNLGTDSTRAYLSALGSSRYGLLSTFQSPHVVVDPTGSLSEAQPVLDRALAAEALNLQHEDYVAICKEGFYPLGFLKAVDPTVTAQKYAQLIDLRTAGQYWGYATDADMVAATGGLTNVKDQLLPRSGMSLKDLLDMLMTRYIGGQLVIESADGGPQFTGELADMRLRLLKADSTTGPLDADICWRLQAFLRLRRKLKWKVDELDSIAVPLAGTRTAAFDAQLLDGLAAVKQMVDLSGRSPTELQPLWGDMNTHGPNSLYARHFIRGPIPIAERPIFEPDQDGNVLQGNYNISDHILTLALALRVSTASLSTIIATTGLADRLTLPNVSFLYRVCLLSQLLDISPADYAALLSLYPAGFDPFESPKTTLALLEQVRALLSAESDPWTLEQLLFVVKGQPGLPGGKYDLDMGKVLRVAVSMFTTLRASGLDSESGPAVEASSRVQRTSKRLFGAHAGAIVARYVNGCSLDKHEQGEALLLIRRHLAARVGPERAESVSSGLLSVQGTAATIAEERAKLFIEAVTPLVPQTRERQIIMESVGSQAGDIDGSILQFALSEIVQVPTAQNQMALQSGMDVLLSLAENTELPGGNFDGYMLPPGTDTYIISIDAATAPAALVLDGVGISFSKATGSTTRWEAKTGPLIEGRPYRLVLTGNANDFRWIAQNMVGNPPASFSQEVLVPEGVVADATAVLSRLIQVSDVISSFGLELGEVAFWQSNGVFDFNALTFQAIRDLQRYSGLKQKFAGRGSVEPLLSLYRWLYNPTSRSDAVLSDLLSAVAARPKRICQDFLLAKYPGVGGESSAEMIGIFKDIGALVQMQEALELMDKLGLQSISPKSLFAVAKPVRPPTVDGDFANAATLRLGLQSTFSGADVNGVKNALAVANDQIRSNSRDALVQCLLLEDYAQKNQLTSADKLFAHFLIDVQMGSSLQTSRIKQAIATVQLFVQRCMLGAEKANGITGAVLMGRDDWDYVMQYRLWEANRKAFLYPENWLDPSLRDDKSQPFMAIESLILQMKLDGTGVRGIIEDYVRQANEVANLQIETYLWERENKNDAGNYNAKLHFFGRTRTSPPGYYYRCLDVGGSALTPIAYWMPWTAMNVGIALHEMDQTGQRLPRPGSYILPAKLGGRLYVFLPDIKAGQRPLDDENGQLTFEQFAQKKKLKDGQADLQWEIQLGYTEYRNGVWSTKKVSHSTIIIPPDSRGAPLPDISTVKFWVDIKKLPPANSDVLAIRVERLGQANGKPAVQLLGQYQLRGQHLLLIGTDGLPVSTWTQPTGAANATVQTTFSKLGWLAPAQSDNNATKSDIYNGSRVVKPWLGYLGRGPDKAQYDWTMSLDTINNDAPTGFVYDVAKVHGTETYFAFPPFMANPNAPEQAIYFNERFYDRVSPLLMDTVNHAAGLDALYGVFSQLPKEAYPDAFGQRNSKIFHEKSTPFAIYNWELGVHIPSLIMERLMATQQFDLALDVARLAFDPSADGDRVDRPWKFPPFKDEQIRTSKGPDFDLDWKKKMSMDEWRANSFSVHAAARGNPVSYMKRIAMKYIEILIAAGDHYFRQNSLETIPLALQRYIEASQVFGPPPVELPALGKRAVKSYNQIAKDLTIMSNATVDMELELPFYSEPGKRGNGNTGGHAPLGLVRTEYFCLPGNPFMVNLRTLIDDRLYKIRNGLDIDGVKRTLALWEPPIDPALVVRANALRAMAGLAPPGADPDAAAPKYRFSYVVKRAQEVAKQLRRTESRLLMIKEKKDAAALAALQVEHRKTLADLSRSIEEDQKTDLQKQIDLLEQQRKTEEMVLKHNSQLTGDNKKAPKTDESWEDIPQEYTTLPSDALRMSRHEADEIRQMEASSNISKVAKSLRLISGVLNAIPYTYIQAQPVGVGMSCAFSGKQIAAFTDSLAIVSEIESEDFTTKANISFRQSSAMQRLQQRRLDANKAGRAIEHIDMQIAQLRAKLGTHETTMKLKQEMVDSVAAEAKWLQSKYSNEQLYSSLDNSLGALLYQTYVTGKEMAAKAQEMLDREKPAARNVMAKANNNSNQGGGTSFLDRAVQSGHLLGEALALDLARLEAAEMEDPEADAEVQKTVSLRQLDPLALLELRESGTASFRLPESVFDMDFPGHYYRRIVSVGLSVPCVADRHTSLNCTLSLQSHKHRVTPQARDADAYNDAADDNGGVDASAFRTDRIPIASVAVGTCTMPSTGAGTVNQQQQQQHVELNFSPSSGGNKDKYGPFEGAGAISDWQIRLPSAVRPFDYDTISDVLLHIKYTAFNGGDDFRQTAENALLKRLARAEGTASVMAIELASEYPDQWRSCVASSKDSTASTLDLLSLRGALPYWAQRAKAKAENVMLLVTPKPAAAALDKLELRTSQSNTVKLAANGGALNAGGHAALVSQSAVGDVTNDWKIVGLGGNSTITRAWLLVEYTVTGLKR